MSTTTNYSATIRVTDTETGEVETFGINPEAPVVMGMEARRIVRLSVMNGAHAAEKFLTSGGNQTREGRAAYRAVRDEVRSIQVLTGGDADMIEAKLTGIAAAAMAARNDVMVDLTGAA